MSAYRDVNPENLKESALESMSWGACSRSTSKPVEQADKAGDKESTIEDAAGAFTFFDHDGDGVITTKELGSVMKAMGRDLDHRQLQAILSAVDTNGDGIIEFEEFRSLLKDATSRDSTQLFIELRQAFKVMDKDNDGFITAQEIVELMKSFCGETITEEEVRSMMTEADTDGDGRIDYKEFVKIISEEGDK